MYVVIMAGGGGTRLRPLSTAERPKPFLPLLPAGETLLQRTVRRLEALGLPPGSVSVVAKTDYTPLVEAQLPGIRVVEEPAGRNTAAAIALATLAIERDDDDVMIVLPADHRIDPAGERSYCDVLRKAATSLATGAFGVADPLVTLGVQVTRPATEYGYLLPAHDRGARVDGLDTYPLVAFEEKPEAARAQALQGMPGVAWNAGMFLWRRRAIRAALEAHAPDVVGAVEHGLRERSLDAAYLTFAPRSIDYAVMEPAARAGIVVMGVLEVGWTDIGSWPALLEVLGAAGVDGGVLEAGDRAETLDGDLVVERGDAGLVVREVGRGTITPDRPVALLRGARDARHVVRSLLDRCAAAEAPA